jgi:phosphate uptake regulator
MTLPAEWATAQQVEKGDEVSIRMGSKGTLTVTPASVQQEESEAIIHARELDADSVERAILAQYVLGRRVIDVSAAEGETLDSSAINAVYNAETQLMGLGVIEETPESIAIRCSVDPEDFTLDNLLMRLESTGSTMRNEAIKAIDRGNPDLAQRALNRERQANKIFVLLLRLIFTAYQNPNLASAVGLDGGFPLIGYRSIAKNLELTADNAEDIAEIALTLDDHTLDVDEATMRQVRAFTSPRPGSPRPSTVITTRRSRSRRCFGRSKIERPRSWASSTRWPTPSCSECVSCWSACRRPPSMPSGTPRSRRISRSTRTASTSPSAELRRRPTQQRSVGCRVCRRLCPAAPSAMAGRMI